MQIESIDFNEFKPIIHDIVKEFLEEEKKKTKRIARDTQDIHL